MPSTRLISYLRLTYKPQICLYKCNFLLFVGDLLGKKFIVHLDKIK